MLASPSKPLHTECTGVYVVKNINTSASLCTRLYIIKNIHPCKPYQTPASPSPTLYSFLIASLSLVSTPTRLTAARYPCRRAMPDLATATGKVTTARM